MAWSHGGSNTSCLKWLKEGLFVKQPSSRPQARIRLSSISGNPQLCTTFTSKEQRSFPLRENSGTCLHASYMRFCIRPNVFRPLWSIRAEPASTKDAKPSRWRFRVLILSAEAIWSLWVTWKNPHWRGFLQNKDTKSASRSFSTGR